MKHIKRIFLAFFIIGICEIFPSGTLSAKDEIQTANDFVQAREKTYKIDHKETLKDGSFLIGYKSGNRYYVEKVTPSISIVGKDKNGKDIKETSYTNSRFDANQYGNHNVKTFQDFENLCKDGKNKNGQMCRVTLLRGDSGGKSLKETVGNDTKTVAQTGLNQGIIPINKPASVQDVTGCSTDYGLFSGLIDAGRKIFNGLRELIYVVAGFGIIGVAVGGFFGNLNYKWLGAIVISLVIIASTGELIYSITGCETFTTKAITDTLK